GLPRFLDLEVPPRTSGSTTGRLGECGSRAHHSAGESGPGRATPSRRVAQARPRRLAAKRCPANAAPPEATLADLAHVPPEPPRRPRLRRLLRRADRDLPRALRVRGRAAPSPQDRALQRDRFPHGRLDRSADRRRFPGGLGAALPPARSRQHLRRRVPSTSEGHGHRRGSYGAPFALAEPLRRARDGNDPPRTTRPRDRPERGTPPSSFAELSPLLPRLADASRAREGCTRAARRRATRTRPRRCPASRRRPPPPLRSPRGVVAVDELSRFGNEIRAQSALARWSCRRPRRKAGHARSCSTPWMVIGRTRLVASSIGHLVDSTSAIEFWPTTGDRFGPPTAAQTRALVALLPIPIPAEEPQVAPVGHREPQAAFLHDSKAQMRRSSPRTACIHAGKPARSLACSFPLT